MTEPHLPQFECKHCGHKWTPRGIVHICPACKSKYWNQAPLPKIKKHEHQHSTRGRNAYHYCQLMIDAGTHETICDYNDCRKCPELSKLWEKIKEAKH